MSKIQFPLFVILDESNQPSAILRNKDEANKIVHSMNEFRMEEGRDIRRECSVERVENKEELITIVEGWNSSLEHELVSDGIAFIELGEEE